jgi:hypothetical protein
MPHPSVEGAGNPSVHAFLVKFSTDQILSNFRKIRHSAPYPLGMIFLLLRSWVPLLVASWFISSVGSQPLQ